MDWTNIPAYRKRPARWKAFQYVGGELPPGAQMTYTGIVLLNKQRLKKGDWAVLDLETRQVVVISEDAFPLVFEKDEFPV